MSKQVQRSFVIPILDFSPHSPYNIRTLLADLECVKGEVICIFNTKEVYDELKTHPRIDKFCYNNQNAGVSRSWNMGINMAEGRAVFIMNADLHIKPVVIDDLENYLFTLENAVIVGPQGAIIDYARMNDVRYYTKGSFPNPVECDAISGFLFSIHSERFLRSKLSFDVRFSPCFFEEWDMGLQLKQAGLSCYAVPVVDFEHHWGVSQAEGDTAIIYFGRDLMRNEILLRNRERFIHKWQNVINGSVIPSSSDLSSSEETAGIRKASRSVITDDGIHRLVEFIERTQRQAYSEGLSPIHSHITNQMLSDFLNRYPLSPGAKILDVGCGQGPALDLFRDRGYQTVGITISEEDVRVCKGKGHDAHRMDQSFLNFPDASFDFIWVRHCIEHSLFPFFTLSEFYRVASDGAYMYLEVPAPNTACHHETNLNHYSVMTREMWASLIERAGFLLLERTDLAFETFAGPDEYWAFICRKRPEHGMTVS